MEFSARQIAEIIDGKIIGDPDSTVSYVSKIEEGKPGTISFLANPKYKHYIFETKASIVLVSQEIEIEENVNPTLVVVEDAYSAFAKLLEVYNTIKLNKTGTVTCFLTLNN